MNERIRELQKQSSVEQWDYDNGCYRYVLNPEKFAELIVRECAEFTHPVTRKFIFEHFGVEE